MAINYLDALGHDVEQERKTADYIREHRIWFTVLGAVMIALGIFVALSSVTATIVSIFFLSGILMLEGVLRVVAAFSAKEWVGSLLLVLAGAFYVVTGILTFRHPVTAALALTLLFAALFLCVGLFRVIAAIWYRFPHWGWVALSGAVSVPAGIDAVERLAGFGALVHRLVHRHRPDRRRRGLARASRWRKLRSVAIATVRYLKGEVSALPDGGGRAECHSQCHAYLRRGAP